MNLLVTGRPDPSEHAPYYEKYTARVPEENLVAALSTDRDALLALIRSIPEPRADHRYAPDKWSIRQVFQHLVDSERVFGFRAFWFARKAPSELPSFEQDDFIKGTSSRQPLASIAAEFEHLRRSHIDFFQALEPEAWRRSGIASGNAFTVRALAAILVGHSRHHAAVLRERYLV